MNDFVKTLLINLQVGVYVGIAPLVAGVLSRFKAKLQGYSRLPSYFQAYYRLFARLWQTSPNQDKQSSVFAIAPYIIFGCYFLLGWLVPLFFLPAFRNNSTNIVEVTSHSDWLVLIYVIGLAHFVTALAGVEAGIPFAGLGSAREMFLVILIEPAFIMAVFAATLKTRTSSLTRTLADNQQMSEQPQALAANGLILLALILIALAEIGRLPFDNPETDKELTMISRAIFLAYKGRQLAILEWAEWLRLTLFIVLPIQYGISFTLPVLLPDFSSPWQDWLWVIGNFAILFIGIIVLAVIESMLARFRLRALPLLSVTALFIAVGAILIAAFF
jgi:formate hydrogenlyase subunit 4